MNILGWIKKVIYPELLVLVLAFIPSSYVMLSAAGSLFYDLLRYAACVWILAFYMKQIDKRSVPWYVLVAAFFLFWGAVTLLSGRTTLALSAVKSAIFAFCLVRIVDFYADADYVNTISTVRLAFEILFWINFCTVILFPGGLYQVTNDANPTDVSRGFFLGHENNAIEYIIPLIGLAMLESSLRKDRLDLHVLVLILASMVVVIMTWSANAIVCVSVFLVFYFVAETPFSRFFRWSYFLGASIAATLLLAVFQLQEKFAWFIVNVLKKNMTLSKRTVIWEKSIPWIVKRPITGYGLELPAERFTRINAVNSCHNYYLDLLYNGGIVLLAIYIAMLVMCVTRISQVTDRRGRAIASTVFGVYSILWIATPLHRGTVAIMFVMWMLLSKLPELNFVTGLRNAGTLTVRIDNPRDERRGLAAERDG